MLGNALFRFFARDDGLSTFGSARSTSVLTCLAPELRDKVVCGIHSESPDGLTRLFTFARPNVVINCIGLIKQNAGVNDPIAAISINSLLPHRLASLCDVGGARLIHIGTDCVFDGSRGMYHERDPSDAEDLYGKSKYLGDVDYPNAITLRTSIIGHELRSSHSLVDWFLSQQESVNGYTRAIFSGLPTVELATVIRNHVMSNPQLHGVYHVSAEPITKFDLLRLLSLVYGKTINIRPDSTVVINRSLDSTLFRTLTGYVPPKWPELVRSMHDFG